MWTRLLNRLLLAAIFFAAGAFGAVLQWVVKHRRRAPPFDGSIFDPGLGHWVVVAGSACALIGFLGRNVMADRLLHAVSETYGVDLPGRPATGIGERVLVAAIALAATAAWCVWQS
jgi:hypothetical protein